MHSRCDMGDLFIAKLPALGSVEVYEAELVEGHRRGPFLQLLKSKCRELARWDSTLLISPTTAALHTPFGTSPPMTLWIMARRGSIGSPKLQEKLKHLGMKMVRQVCVSEAVLQTCYQFSLMARLAPKWNLLGSWLVQGLEFLSTGRAQAIVLQVGVTRTEITLSVNVVKLTLNLLQPSDLGVSIATLSGFMSDPHSVIREDTVCHNRCILLPNLTVGYVFSASHQLPSSSEFPTYDTIRVHWKKQHGMILPEKQSLFFQVFFKSNSSTFFSYPGCCVLKSPPLVSSSRDSRSVQSSFIADLHSRMPTLCGDTIRYSSKALTPFSSLQTATLSPNYPNIKLTSVHGRQTHTSRPPGSHSSVCNTQSRGQRSGLIGRVSAALASASSGHVMSHDRHQVQTVPDISGSSVAVTISRNTSSQSGGNGVHCLSENRSNYQPSTIYSELVTPSGCTRIVPVFKPSHNSGQSGSAQSVISTTKSAPFRPFFKPTSSTTAPTAGHHHTLQTVPMSEKGRVHTHSNLPQKRGLKHTPKDLSLPPTKQLRVATQHTATHTAKHTGTHTAAGSGRCALQHRGKESAEQTVPTLSQMQQNTPPVRTASNGAANKTQKKGRGVKRAIQVEGVGNEIMTSISKVKAPLLRKWLRENGVKCTSKNTKDDMVRLAAEYIRDTGTTFTASS